MSNRPAYRYGWRSCQLRFRVRFGPSSSRRPARRGKANPRHLGELLRRIQYARKGRGMLSRAELGWGRWVRRSGGRERSRRGSKATTSPHHHRPCSTNRDRNPGNRGIAAAQTAMPLVVVVQAILRPSARQRAVYIIAGHFSRSNALVVRLAERGRQPSRASKCATAPA
jgi:hypothetical protein